MCVYIERLNFRNWLMPCGWAVVGGMGFPGGSVVKNLPANAGDACSVSGSGRSPGERKGNQLSILAWEIPEEPGGLQSMRTSRL